MGKDLAVVGCEVWISQTMSVILVNELCLAFCIGIHKFAKSITWSSHKFALIYS